MIALLSAGPLMSLALLYVFVPSGCYANEVLLDPLLACVSSCFISLCSAVAMSLFWLTWIK